MTDWLKPSEDEVRRFHPEFESAANEALKTARYDGTHEWVHHPRTPGSTVIPDFVLKRQAGSQWILAFEIKRNRQAVYSTPNQMQAKGYAEQNQGLYLPSVPRYFAISNLEVTMLFALNGARPPVECRLAQPDGVFESGSFASDAKDEHRRRFVEDMTRVIKVAITERTPAFDTVWPGVLSEFVAYADALLGSLVGGAVGVNIPEPTTPDWPLIRDYFGAPLPVDSSRVFFLRCLMAEFLRGVLAKHGHPRANRIPALRPDHIPASVANAIDALRVVDFVAMFEDTAAATYRTLGDATIKKILRNYVELLVDPGRRVAQLARTRADYPLLLDSLITAIHPLETQDERGKVATDPDLAALLAHLTVPTSKVGDGESQAHGVPPSFVVADPCCGDGALLSASYDRLLVLGMEHEEAIASLAGIEADTVAVRLACVRLALKQPASTVGLK